MSGVRAVFFDLDHCLASPDESGRAFYQPALDAIRAANCGTLGETALESALEDCWTHSLEQVAEIHGFSPQMYQAGWQASLNLRVAGPLKGFPDLPELLQMKVDRFLVTSGFRTLQQSKIEALGIKEWFAEIRIDAIDELPRTGKKAIFEDLLRRHQLEPEAVLVVGDSERSEIAAGNALKIPTVQILRPGVVRSDAALHHISDLRELKALL